jgi:hypothetical protein
MCAGKKVYSFEVMPCALAPTFLLLQLRADAAHVSTDLCGSLTEVF